MLQNHPLDSVKSLIFILAILTSMANAHALSPREELAQMVEQLQKTQTDNALREKIIKLAGGVRPAPAMPNAALRHEKSARSQRGHEKSAGSGLVFCLHRFCDTVSPCPDH